MQSICVFLGSNPGKKPAYLQAAQDLGAELARRGLTTVYGGSNAGLMGALADAALAAGGKVIGIIPEALRKKEVAHKGLTELRLVDSMHERKALMAERADAFIALPAQSFTPEQVSPARDTRLKWMQSVVQCTHYIAGAGEAQYLRREDAPEITYVNRDVIDRSDEAYTDSPA